MRTSSREGYLTEAVLNYVALLGWSPKGELAEQEFFTLPGAGKGIRHLRHLQDARRSLILQKLRWMNAEYIKKPAPGGLL